MKGYSTSYVIREMKIKNNEYMEQQELSFIVGGNDKV